MKRDNLFETTVTCEESMGDVNEYQKLIESPTKHEKVVKGR
jgi:hypothetical protein